MDHDGFAYAKELNSTQKPVDRHLEMEYDASGKMEKEETIFNMEEQVR